MRNLNAIVSAAALLCTADQAPGATPPTNPTSCAISSPAGQVKGEILSLIATINSAGKPAGKVPLGETKVQVPEVGDCLSNRGETDLSGMISCTSRDAKHSIYWPFTNSEFPISVHEDLYFGNEMEILDCEIDDQTGELLRAEKYGRKNNEHKLFLPKNSGFNFIYPEKRYPEDDALKDCGKLAEIMRRTFEEFIRRAPAF